MVGNTARPLSQVLTSNSPFISDRTRGEMIATATLMIRVSPGGLPSPRSSPRRSQRSRLSTEAGHSRWCLVWCSTWALMAWRLESAPSMSDTG